MQLMNLWRNNKLGLSGQPVNHIEENLLIKNWFFLVLELMNSEKKPLTGIKAQASQEISEINLDRKIWEKRELMQQLKTILMIQIQKVNWKNQDQVNTYKKIMYLHLWDIVVENQKISSFSAQQCHDSRYVKL